MIAARRQAFTTTRDSGSVQFIPGSDFFTSAIAESGWIVWRICKGQSPTRRLPIVFSYRAKQRGRMSYGNSDPPMGCTGRCNRQSPSKAIDFSAQFRTF